jgi:hypothetical protein
MDTPVASLDAAALAVTRSGALPEEGLRLSAATGWPTVSWAVAAAETWAVSVTVTVTVYTPPLVYVCVAVAVD